MVRGRKVVGDTSSEAAMPDTSLRRRGATMLTYGFSFTSTIVLPRGFRSRHSASPDQQRCPQKGANCLTRKLQTY